MSVVKEPWSVRQELEGRPALFALLGIVVGLTAVSHPVNLLALIALIGLRSLTGRCWCAGLFIIGLVLAPTPPKKIVGREFLKDAGTVTSTVRHEADVQRCQIDVSRGTFSLILTDGPRLRFGDRIQLQGVAEGVGPSEEAIERQLAAGTIRAGPADITITEPAGPLPKMADNWKSSFQESLKTMPKEAAAVVEASTFGVDDVSPIVTQRLRAAGAISIASISGLQVLLLSSFGLAIAGRAPIPRGVSLALIAAALTAYAIAAGLHAGVVRASVMSVILSSAYLFRREPDVLSALGVTALAELLWRPAWVYDFGFQLSFLVVTTLALYLPKRGRISKRPFWVRAGWAAAGVLAIFLTATPLVAYETGELNLVSPLTSALAVPAVAPIFSLGLSGWAVGLGSTTIGALWMNWLVAPLAGWVLAVSDLGASAQSLTVEIPPFSAYWLCPIYALMVLGARLASSAFSSERS